jgi:hypothetical protein
VQSGIALFLAAVFALVLRASEAWAEEPPAPRTMRLLFTAPSGPDCPGEPIFRDKVNTRMTFNPFDPTAEAELAVSVRRQDLLYQGRLDLRDGAGALLWPRELPPVTDCGLLMERLAFTLSVKLDPLGAPTAPPLSVARRSYRLRVGAGAALGWGVAPGPAFGATLDLGVRWPWVSISLEGRAYPAASGTTDGTLVALSRFTGAAVPCGHWRWLFGCGLVELGALRVTAETDRPTATTSLHTAAGARFGVEWSPHTSLAVRLSGDLTVAIQRSVVHLEGQARWQTPLVGGALGAGLLTHF